MPPFSLPGDVQWFPAEIRRLIVAIKKQDSLYNPKNECFGLRDFQGKAWKTVAEEVGGGKTDIQCRDKWNCLRGTYRRHVRTEATNAVKRRSGWPWADMMSFIKPFVWEQDLPPKISPKPSPPVTPKLPTVPAKGTLTPITLAGNMFPGGIIIKSNGKLNFVQPGQVTQSSRGPIVKLVPATPSQPGTGVGVVQPTKKPAEKEISTSMKSKSPLPDTIEIDLKRIKRDPDASSAPTSTEFVDMEIAIKKEPLEEEELQLPESFTYLPEDSSQDISQDADSSRESDGGSDKNLPDQSSEDIDCNELFLRSTICHMRKLNAYDQSIFKLKVQQLLHEMMFPKQQQP